MTTITINEDLGQENLHFETLADFQEYLLIHGQEVQLSEEHREVLLERLEEDKHHPESGEPWEKVKNDILKDL